MAAKQGLSVTAWIQIGTFVILFGGVIVGVAFKVFATRDQVHTIELKEMQSQGVQRLQEWRIKTVETKVDNIQIQQTRIDKNVESLLGRFRVKSEPPPDFKPLPDPPTPAELLTPPEGTEGPPPGE